MVSSTDPEGAERSSSTEDNDEVHPRTRKQIFQCNNSLSPKTRLSAGKPSPTIDWSTTPNDIIIKSCDVPCRKSDRNGTGLASAYRSSSSSSPPPLLPSFFCFVASIRRQTNQTLGFQRRGRGGYSREEIRGGDIIIVSPWHSSSPSPRPNGGTPRCPALPSRRRTKSARPSGPRKILSTRLRPALLQ